MPVRISQKHADAMRARLLDPVAAALLAPPSPSGRSGSFKAAQESVGKPHRAPKVARRVAVGGGPEGRGHLTCDPQGRVVALDLWLDLLPVPKERPRVVRTKSGKTVSFTPPRTKRFTSDVATVAKAVMAGNSPIHGAVALTMVFRMQIPPSWPLWRQKAAAEGRVVPTARPDMDNLEKALLDALNGLAFTDDALVVDRLARKRFGVQPGIRLRVESLPVATQTDKRERVLALPMPTPILDTDGEGW